MPNYHDASQTRMLIEDVRLSIMPYRGYGRNSFDVRVTPGGGGVEDLIEEAVSRRGRQRDLPHAVAEFVRECATSVMAYGRATYEIACAAGENGEPGAFALLTVPPCSVRVEGGRLVQYVPAAVAKEQGLDSNPIKLTQENFIDFELPPGVRHAHATVMNALAANNEAAVPKFVTPSMTGAGPRVPFDISHFERTQKLAIAHAAKPFGWGGRFMLNSKHVTEYYQWHRFLLFEKFKVELRDNIVRTLNEAIARAGRKLGFEDQLVLEGLPTLAHVKDAQDALETGSRTFGEIIGAFRIS